MLYEAILLTWQLYGCFDRGGKKTIKEKKEVPGEWFFLCDFRPIATLLPHWHRQRPTPLGFSSRKPPSPDLHLPNHRRSPPAARRHRPGRAPSPRWSAPPLFLPTTGSHLLPCRLKPQTSILARPRSPPTWDPISPCHRFLICLQIYLNQ